MHISMKSSIQHQEKLIHKMWEFSVHASAATKHHSIPYRNTPPSVWSGGLSRSASLHIAGHQLMQAVKVESCHACMAHAVLHHQLLYFMKYLALWGVEPAVTHQASWLESRGIHGERQTQAGGSFLLLVTWVAVQPPRAQLVCASKVVCRPPQSVRQVSGAARTHIMYNTHMVEDWS